MTTEHRRCTVYAGHGEAQISSMTLDPHSKIEAPPTSADAVPLADIMSRELVCARPDLEISVIVSLMAQHRVGCIPVVDDRRRAIGVITKLDLVEQLDASLRADGLPCDLAARTAEEVMMPLALVLDEHATVAHAASMMLLEDTHHVLVIRKDQELVGIVSSKDIVRWLARTNRLFSALEGTEQVNHTLPRVGDCTCHGS